MIATVNFYFDTRLHKDEKKGIVKFFVTYNRNQRPFSTKIKLLESDWLKLKRNVINGELSTKLRDDYFVSLYNQIYGENSDYVLAKSIVEKLGSNFSFDEFKILFYSKTIEIKQQTLNTVKDIFVEKIRTIKLNDQVSTVNIYQSLLASLKRFVAFRDNKLYLNFDDLKFEHITVEFLKDYEKWLLRYGKYNQYKDTSGPATITTVGIYLRHFRSIFNDAIHQYKIVDAEMYPFSQKGYTIPSTQNTKIALPKTDIQNLSAHLSEYPSIQHRSEQLWLFSYYANGMNFSDICRLKWSDMTTDSFSFYRQKTIRTQKVKQKIEVFLLPQLSEIIRQYGSPKESSTYVFPFLNDTMTEETKIKNIKQLIKTTTKYIRKTFAALGLPPNLSTYHARHSFATILMRSNVSIHFIQESLGHKNLSTTESYLHSFEAEQKKEFIQNLL